MEVKLPTRWTDGKAQPGRSLDREKVRSEKIRDGEDRKGESQKREDAGAREKVGKSRNTVLFKCFVALEGRKVERCKSAHCCGAKHMWK